MAKKKRNSKKAAKKGKNGAGGERSKPWTVLVYLAGDNNLADEMVWSLQEMLRATSLRNFDRIINLRAYYDPAGSASRVYDFNARRRRSLDEVLKETFPDAGKAGTLRLERARTFLARAAGKTYDVVNTEDVFGADLNRLLGQLPHTLARIVTVDLGIDAAASLETRLEELLRESFDAEARSRYTDYALLKLRSFIDKQLEELYDPEVGRNIEERTMVVLSGHGSGAVGDFLTGSTPGGSLSIPQLRELLELAINRYIDVTHRSSELPRPKVEILGMESCAMSMLEVCYEVRDSIRVLVGTESLVQDLGWPYVEMLKPLIETELLDDASAHARAVAEAMVRAYSRFYTDYDIAGVSSDIAAIDVERLVKPENQEPPLPDLIKQLAANAKRDLEAHPGNEARRTQLCDAITVARTRAQSYKVDEYVDLWDFCEELSKALGRSKFDDANGLANTCGKIQDELSQVVLRSCYQGPAYQHSHGLGLYFPTARANYREEYESLQFAIDTQWSEFLKAFLELSRRERRCCEEHPERADLFHYETDHIPDRRQHRCIPVADVRGGPKGESRGGPKGESRGGPKGESRLAELVLSETKNWPPGWYRDTCGDPARGGGGERGPARKK